jgi:hypothetical protein
MYGEAEIRPDALQVLCLDHLIVFHISLFLERLYIIRCVKGAFQSVAIKNTKLSEDDHSCSGVLGRLICEFAVGKGKQLISLPKQIRDQPD